MPLQRMPGLGNDLIASQFARELRWCDSTQEGHEGHADFCDIAEQVRREPRRLAYILFCELVAAIGHDWANVSTQIAEWRHRIRSRRELLTLGEHDLRDIGLRPVDANREASKPFWRE
jgi:uncharacterized protein YjiS (DUF1127 family)